MTNPALYRNDSRVRHMLSAIDRIVDLGKDLKRDQLQMQENTTELILFNLMVLGEAANNISREFAALNPGIDWKGLAGVRHKIVHDYADIDFDIIWDILQKDIPDAHEKIKALAGTLPPEPTQPPANLGEFL